MQNKGTKTERVTGRLAPSPTGALHLGNARSFLIAWLSVRSQSGRLVMRMEDLDHPKVKPGAAAEIYKDLRWLGLDWDEGPDVGGSNGPYVQTQRRGLYHEALGRLQAAGRVYPCACSRSDVAGAQSAPHAEDGQALRYPGTCRERFASWDEAVAVLPADRLPAWRFRVASGTSEFEDIFCGHHALDPSEVTGGFALARDPDGAGYMLAVVVDDAAMGVTEVVRGDDLLDATHSQLALHRALGLSPPRYMHVPLVVAEDGHRLAKRHGDTRLVALREAGILPEQIVGLLAWWCGWASFGERLMPAELLSRYDLTTLRRSPVVLTQDIKEFLQL